MNMNAPTANAEISLKEVYEVLVEVRDDVTSIKKELENTTKDVDDHEARIRQMEKAQWRWAGAAAAVGAVISFVGDRLFT